MSDIPYFDIKLKSKTSKITGRCILVTLICFLIVGFCEFQFNPFAWSFTERTVTLVVAIIADVITIGFSGGFGEID